jgi:hypothetical protein
MKNEIFSFIKENVPENSIITDGPFGTIKISCNGEVEYICPKDSRPVIYAWLRMFTSRAYAKITPLQYLYKHGNS